MKKYKLAFFVYFSFIAIGVIVSQTIPLINDITTSFFHKNSILGLSAFISLIFAFYVGKKSDNIGEIKPSFIMSMCIYIGLVIVFFLVSSKIFQGILFLLILGVVKNVMSTCETFILVNESENYPKYHCFGALGLMSGALLAGNISNDWKLILCVISGIASIAFILKIDEKKSKRKKITNEQVKRLLLNQSYQRILGLVFFLMMIGFADQYIVIDKMISLNASKQLISIKYAIQALMEIPVYLSIHFLLKRLKPLNLLLLTILMNMVKFIGYSLSITTFQIILFSLLQVCTHPLIVILSKKLIMESTPADLKSTSQIVGFAIYFGLSGFMTPLLSQILSQFLNLNMILIIFAFFNLIPLLIWYFMKKYDKVNAGD